VAIYNLPGIALGFLVIVAHNGNALRETAVETDEIGVIAGYYALLFKPGKCSQSHMAALASACSARLTTASRAAPEGGAFASLRSRVACSAKRASTDFVCVGYRLRIAFHPSCQVGAQLSLSHR
jgi:hypothetical protein